MRHFFLSSFLLASSALGAAVAGGAAGQQKPLNNPKQTPDAARQSLSCVETYGRGWETCGENSKSCYSPALGQSCCIIDNGYCDRGTWCAPVAGYCCRDDESLEECAKNAGFEIPDKLTLAAFADGVVLTSKSW